VIPYKTSDSFAFKAKMDGKIISIDTALNIAKIEYTDKSIEAIRFGEISGESSGMGVNQVVELLPNLKVGSKISQGDLVTINKSFFDIDPITNTVSWCHGVPANVAILAKDVTLEDSNMLTSEFANKLNFDSIHTRSIVISADMIITNHVSVGDLVEYNTPLIELEYEGLEGIIKEDVDELFTDLKQVKFNSKEEGQIVDIEIFHSTEMLNSSIIKFINKVTLTKRKQAHLTKDTSNNHEFIPVTHVEPGTRIKGTVVDESDILILYYIKSNIACGIGDKIVIDSSLKSIVGKIEPNEIISEHNEKVDVVFSANSVFNRIILSPIISGIYDKILKHAEHDVINMYFGEIK